MRHIVFALLLVLCAVVAHAQAPAKQTSAAPVPAAQAPPKADAQETGFAMPNTSARPWTGDLDGMVKRRRIRFLVPYSKTYYFVDRAVQRGVAYDITRIYEADLNKRLKTGHIRIDVHCIPVARDEMIPALLAGRDRGRSCRQGNLRAQVVELLREPREAQPGSRRDEEATGAHPACPGDPRDRGHPRDGERRPGEDDHYRDLHRRPLEEDLPPARGPPEHHGPHRRRHRLDDSQAEPSAHGRSERVSRQGREVGREERDITEVLQEHEMGEECHVQGGAREVRADDRTLSQVWREVRRGVSVADGAGIPGIGA